MQDLFSVKGKTACVTGASSGLGKIAASLLADAGANVVAVARREERLVEWASGHEKRAFVVADISDKKTASGLAPKLQESFGEIDILVNAAGVNRRDHADDVTVETWNETIDLNLAAPFFLAQALLPGMRAKGWGRILNFASLQSRRAFTNGLSYGASKGGISQLTRAMAEAWSNDGIITNAIAPGFFPTELTAAVFGDDLISERHAAQTCIGRNGQAEDLHGAIVFFCSDACRYITGQTLFIDGGYTAK